MNRNQEQQAFITTYPIGNIVELDYDGDVIIEGVVASNRRDIQGDVFEKSFLKQMLNDLNEGPPVYLNHFYHKTPIGKVQKAKYYEDKDTGDAWVWARSIIDTPDQDFKRRVARKDIGYHSVGGHLNDHEFSKADGAQYPTRHCKTGKVLELSITPAPINIAAGLSISKGMSGAQAIDVMKDTLDWHSGLTDTIREKMVAKGNLFKSMLSMGAEKLEAHLEEFDNEIAKANLNGNSGHNNINSSEERNMQGKTDQLNKAGQAGSGSFDNMGAQDKPKSQSDFHDGTHEGQLIEHGTGTKVETVDTAKFYNPGAQGSTPSDDSLNTTSKMSQDFFAGTGAKSQVTTMDEQKRNAMNEHSDSWISGQAPQTTPTSSNKEYPDNATSEKSQQWIANQAHTFVQEMNGIQKGIVIDSILHPANMRQEMWQCEDESAVEAAHRLLELANKRRFGKGGKWRELIDAEVTELFKGVNWSPAKNNIFDNFVLMHLVSPEHIDVVEPLMYSAGIANQPISKGLPGMDEEEPADEASAEAAPPSDTGGGFPPSQQEQAPPGGAMGAGAMGEDAETGVTMDEVNALRAQDPEIAKAMDSIASSIMAQLQGSGEQVDGGEAGILIEKALKEFVALLKSGEQEGMGGDDPAAMGGAPMGGASGGSVNMPQGGGVDQGEGFSEDDIRKAVEHRFNQAQQDVVLKARANTPSEFQYPDNLTDKDRQITCWMQQWTDGGRNQ